MDYLKFLQQEIHTTVAATVDDDGLPVTCAIDIMDADGSASLPVAGGAHLTEDLVGAHLENYDYVLSLAHFKGHAMGGFGGALKNCSIGIASREGKMLIHSAGASTTGWGAPRRTTSWSPWPRRPRRCRTISVAWAATWPTST